MILSAKERDSWRGNRDFVSFAVYISMYTLSLQSHLYLLLLGFFGFLFFVVGFFSQNQYKNITMNCLLMSEKSWPFCGIKDSFIFHLKL